jgi:hypothetical protein
MVRRNLSRINRYNIFYSFRLVNMAKDKQYLIFKNFVHNELGITKDNFKDLFTQAIKEEAKAFVQRQFQKDNEKFVIVATENIKNEVYNKISGRSWDSGRDALFKGIGEEIAKSIKIEK